MIDDADPGRVRAPGGFHPWRDALAEPSGVDVSSGHIAAAVCRVRTQAEAAT